MRTGTLRMANVAVALTLLLGAGAAQAEVIFDPDDATRAIRIENLAYDGDLWDVTFTGNVNAASVYGDFPGMFDFGSDALAAGAVDAVNAELNTADAASVGSEDLLAGFPLYRIGFGSGSDPGTEVETVFFWEGTNGDGPPNPWVKPSMSDGDCYTLCTRVWAAFTPVPEPGATLSAVVALASLGVVGRCRRRRRLR